MVKEIKWSLEAEQSFEKIISYLTEKRTTKEIVNFVSSTQRTLSFIAANPLLFRKSEKINLREAVVTKHNLLLIAQSLTTLS